MGYKIDWQEIFRSFSDGLMVTDSDFTIRFVNLTFRDLLQNESLKLKGAKCYEVFAGYLCHTSDCPLVKVKNTQKPQLYSARGHCKIKRQGPS